MNAYQIWRSDYYIPLLSRQLLAHEQLNTWLSDRGIAALSSHAFDALLNKLAEQPVRCLSILLSITCDTVLTHCHEQRVTLPDADRLTLREQMAPIFGWHPQDV